MYVTRAQGLDRVPNTLHAVYVIAYYHDTGPIVWKSSTQRSDLYAWALEFPSLLGFRFLKGWGRWELQTEGIC